MNKERKLISQDEKLVFDRNIKTSELNSLIKEFCREVVITGDLVIDQKFNSNCNMHVKGKVIHKGIWNEYPFCVKGDLYCESEVSCLNIEVAGSFYCEGDILCRDIRVEKNFQCNRQINAFGHTVIVKGNLKCSGIQAKELLYSGVIDIHGPAHIANGMKKI